MSSMVKNVFLTLIGSTVALMLYFAFFGVKDWRGVLFYASEVVESSISRYYYEYCYLPNMHMNDSIDKKLGCFTSTTVQNTETYLGSNGSSKPYNNVTYPSEVYGDVAGSFYTTDWK